MDIAFYLPGRVPVYTFPLILAIGSTVGIFSIARRSPDKLLTARFQAMLWGLTGAAILGRIVHITVHWTYYSEHMIESAQIWLGGISGAGALLGGLLAVAIYAVITKRNLAHLMDSLRPLLTTITVSAWLGCWINGVFYGPQVQAWWGVPATDEWGEISLRWPLQPTVALITLLIAWGIDRIQAREQYQTPGLAASLEVGAIALLFVGAAFLRADPVPKLGLLNLNTWIALGIFIATLIALAVFIRRKPDKETKT